MHVAVLTLNVTCRVKEALEAVGLAEAVDHIYGCDVPPYGSTKGERMAGILEQFGAVGGSGVLVDDDEKNVKAARAAGFGAIHEEKITAATLGRILLGEVLH